MYSETVASAKNHPRPSTQPATLDPTDGVLQYAASVATDPSCQTIMTALLFVVNRPYLVGIVPVRDTKRERA